MASNVKLLGKIINYVLESQVLIANLFKVFVVNINFVLGNCSYA